MGDKADPKFPHSITLTLPIPPRHALIIRRAIEIDPEISPLVSRTFLYPPHPSPSAPLHPRLEVTYAATTARMLRVSVNAFFSQLAVVLSGLAELDGEETIGREGWWEEGVDGREGREGWGGVQGLMVEGKEAR
ncbi:hypothetical protein P152DRAFT_470750 [Eremomyces bilateralis CBS 781.70]|uniref:Pcc1-domain-containing protein n=1 Tax=Eremomyces bilateralis CBS 781.70 TaxID=1392243 RepID=A0A6G1GBM3_9PEZI|nr:uncharacterized protein P152DRAFT_470750 [Eremomyces bilateralis CBS 781.70]KAF1815300.1 hypothetical protein P152DRAFT_470750 [Eremomyces bilateralis CBS 781.70]